MRQSQLWQKSFAELNFHDYRVLRLNEMAAVEVHIVPRTAKPGGVGEVAVPPIASAVANAVAALTGQRLRESPLTLSAAIASPGRKQIL